MSTATLLPLEDILADIDLEKAVPCQYLDGAACPTPAVWAAVLDCPRRHSMTFCGPHRIDGEHIITLFEAFGGGVVCVPCTVAAGERVRVEVITWRSL